MADSTPKSYHTDPTLYLYTSLTAGSSHIITATSRLETILKANRIPFQALDVATDEKARMLWGRRAGKRKLPGLVRMGMIIGDINEVEEWNEYGELKENVGAPAPAASTPTPSAANTPSKAPIMAPVSTSSDNASTSTPSKASSETTTKEQAPQSAGDTLASAMRQAGLEAAKKAGDAKSKLKGTSTSTGGSSQKLKQSDTTAPTDVPPSSGTTETSSTKPSEDGDSSTPSRADGVVSTDSQVKAGDHTGVSKVAAESSTSLLQSPPASTPQITQHRNSSVSLIGGLPDEEIKAVEERSAIKEEDENEIEDVEEKGGKEEQATTAAAAVEKVVPSHSISSEGQAKQDGPGDIEAAISKSQERPEGSAGGDGELGSEVGGGKGEEGKGAESKVHFKGHEHDNASSHEQTTSNTSNSNSNPTPTTHESHSTTTTTNPPEPKPLQSPLAPTPSTSPSPPAPKFDFEKDSEDKTPNPNPSPNPSSTHQVDDKEDIRKSGNQKGDSDPDSEHTGIRSNEEEKEEEEEPTTEKATSSAEPKSQHDGEGEGEREGDGDGDSTQNQTESQTQSQPAAVKGKGFVGESVAD
ncbi:hypothetical protein MMC09_006329 [Bachmanniomyces sp. S44760]|nr:hypothetical protein [Bachmanniomyces sp. S44760]